MSLVSEALRKARQEDERERSQGPRQRFFFGGYGSASSRLGTGLVLGAMIACVAALAGGSVAWWLIGAGHDAAPVRSADPVPSSPPQENAVADAAAAVEAAPAAVSDVATDQPVAARPAAVDGYGPAGGRRDVQVGNDAAVTASGEGDRADIRQQPAATPAPVAAQGGSREFVGEATIGDVTLTLGYLVYRPTDPFVQLNGIDVRVGSIIEGFVIDEITKDRVILHDDDGPVVIRVH